MTGSKKKRIARATCLGFGILFIQTVFRVNTILFAEERKDAEKYIVQTYYSLCETEEPILYPQEVIYSGNRYRMSDILYETEEIYETVMIESEKKWRGAFYEPEAIWFMEETPYILQDTKEIVSEESNRHAEAKKELFLWEEQEAEDTIEVEVLDPITNELVTGTIPVKHITEDCYMWRPNTLSLSCIFINYENESNQYQVGDLTVEIGETPMFDGYQDYFLDMYHLNKETNRITDIAWKNDAYVNEAGVRCREAVISGETLCKGKKIIYEGMVALPNVEMVVYRNQYRSEKKRALIAAYITYEQIDSEEVHIKEEVKQDLQESMQALMYESMQEITKGISDTVHAAITESSIEDQKQQGRFGLLLQVIVLIIGILSFCKMITVQKFDELK